MRPTSLVAAALLLPAATLAGCTSGDDGDTTLTVLAASSLTDTFTELADLFEAEHPGVDVKLSFGSSTTLAEQVTQGAPGDVLATADQQSMAIAADAGVLHDDADAFATNRLVLVVPAGNPAGVHGLGDLAGTDWVRCVADAPCGKVTDTLLAAQDADAVPSSLEVDVKAVLAKVASGEADAGLVYASDALAAGDDVETLEIPGAGRELTTYYVAALSHDDDEDLACDWVDLVTSAEGRAVLTDAGFGAP